MKIALIGNPNTGKSSIFNMLTGLRQQVGNFPGVTVELRQGTLQIGPDSHQIIDFPGTYSIFPHSSEEAIGKIREKQGSNILKDEFDRFRLEFFRKQELSLNNLARAWCNEL